MHIDWSIQLRNNCGIKLLRGRMHLLSIPTTVFVIPDMIVESENNIQVYLIYFYDITSMTWPKLVNIAILALKMVLVYDQNLAIRLITRYFLLMNSVVCICRSEQSPKRPALYLSWNTDNGSEFHSLAVRIMKNETNRSMWTKRILTM